MVKTVFSRRFGIDPSLPAPSESDFDRVRQGTKELEGDIACHVRARVDDAKTSGGISPDEYFARREIEVAGLTLGRVDGSVASAMKTDVRVGGFRAGRIDSFDIAAMRQILGDSKIVLDPKVRADLESRVAAYDTELGHGAVKAGTYVDAAGAIHELAEGRIEVDYQSFIARMNPADWSPNLPRYKGGEVREIDSKTRSDGVREVRQQERMSLDSFPNNLDMTKNTIVEIGRDSAKVSWHVFHSDPTILTLKTRSVMQDDGYIELSKTPDGKVLVRSHSKHKISTPGSKLARFFLGDRITGELAGQAGLAGFFKEMIERYRAIGLGELEPAETARG